MPLQIIGTEWIWVILVVVLLLFGSKKIPEVARGLGKAMGEFQRGRQEIERELKAATATFETATAQPSSPVKVEKAMQSEREKLEKVAADLGVAYQGKSDEELRELIKKTLG